VLLALSAPGAEGRKDDRVLSWLRERRAMVLWDEALFLLAFAARPWCGLPTPS
jgi:hypothetical protein